MTKKVFFFIDDVIWVFRDLARQKPASMFDNPFLKILKNAYDRYGVKTQLNIFYRTDFFYGNDEFTLAEMPDTYKSEWEESSDWLKLGFHAKQEFPDYPYVNASYDDVKANFESIYNEVVRFAGKKTFALSTVMHWSPVSKEGCKAFRDCGIKLMDATVGERFPYNDDPASLPYGHAFRLLQNRKPETALFHRGTRDEAVDNSLCAYNHLPMDTLDKRCTTEIFYDEEIGMYFKSLELDLCLNLTEKKDLLEQYTPYLDCEYVGYMTHEQYFYPEFYGYQPDMDEKIYYVGELFKNNNFEHFFPEELVK